MPGSGWEPSPMFRSGWDALPDVWQWSGGLPDCSGVVKRLSRMSGSGREALPDVLEWSKAIPDFRE